MPNKEKIWIIFFCILLSGCVAEYESISSTSIGRELIGRKYILLEPLTAYGIVDLDNYSEGVVYYTLVPPPGIAGPEIIESHDLAKGECFVVKDVYSCKNCFLWKRNDLYLVIEFVERNVLNAEVRIHRFIHYNEKNKRIELDRTYFKTK